jgi:hypothetical protein
VARIEQPSTKQATMRARVLVSSWFGPRRSLSTARLTMRS